MHLEFQAFVYKNAVPDFFDYKLQPTFFIWNVLLQLIIVEVLYTMKCVVIFLLNKYLCIQL